LLSRDANGQIGGLAAGACAGTSSGETAEVAVANVTERRSSAGADPAWYARYAAALPMAEENQDVGEMGRKMRRMRRRMRRNKKY
jgi:hypothetical protein